MAKVKTCDYPSRHFLQQHSINEMKTEKPFSDIAARIKWHRSLEGLSQEDYAHAAGVKRSQLSNWESGAQRVSIDGAILLRKTYGLSLDFIYEGISDTLPMSLRVALRDNPLDRNSK